MSAKPPPLPRSRAAPARAPSPSIYPRVRDQLKILAVEHGLTMHQMVTEALDDLFEKHGKPRIAGDGGRKK